MTEELKWRPHPVIRPPSPEELALLSHDEALALHALHTEAVENAVKDPLEFGIKFPMWERIEREMADPGCPEAWIFGGNRSGKTHGAAALVMKSLLENPGSRIFCFSQSEKTSQRQMQPVFWDLMPPELRKSRRDSTTKICYKAGSGFTDSQFILPNGSRCEFYFYTQFANDSSVFEGAELGGIPGSCGSVSIGCWLDEYLGGPALVETMRQRLWTRDSKLLVTFTPIWHYTETVRRVLKGAITMESVAPDPDLLPNVSRVPTVQRPSRNNSFVSAGTRMFYLHTKDNPFSSWNRTRRDLVSKPENFVKCRAYGVPTEELDCKFPQFSDENIVSPKDVPKVGTDYCVLDPGGSKNHFLLWCRVDPHGVVWVMREWPDANIGDWAEWRDERWRPGAGQRGLGYGVDTYRDLIVETEETCGFDVFSRLVDPRMGMARYMGDEGEESIASRFESRGLYFDPAAGLHEEDGIQALQDLMWHDDSQPVGPGNMRRFYVSSDCENTILAIREYEGISAETGSRKKTEALKDPIDCLRYLVTTSPEYVDRENFKQTRNALAGAYGAPTTSNRGRHYNGNRQEIKW